MLISLAACVARPPALIPGPTLDGLCAPAGAVWTGAHLVVSDAGDNRLRVYDRDGAAAGSVDLGTLSPALTEPADLEGLALGADGVAWLVGAHTGGGVDGEVHATPTHRLLAVRLTDRADGVDATLVAGPGTGLVESGQWTNPLMGIVSNTIGASSHSASGFALGGAAPGPDGTLVLGFRAPTHGHKALIEQLRDPAGVAGGGSPSLVGPYWLDLGGNGIRSLAADGSGLLLLAGPADDDGAFALHRWAALDLAQKPVPVAVDLGDLRPDVVVRVGDDWWLLAADPAGSCATRTARIPGQ